jgi:uncharacterized protein (DUF433 family)
MMLKQVAPTVSITIDPQVMSGTPVFAGTRVPIQTLFDYLIDDCTLTEFFENFPSVRREAAVQILEYAARQITDKHLVA